MFVLSIIAASLLLLIGVILFIDCKIVSDLPKDNSFKKWWHNHIIAPDPKG